MNDYFEMGPIRPPSEAQSLLIRVTRNCPWNKCEFCHTYKGENFSFRSVEEIKKDIDAAKAISDEICQISWRMGFAGKVNQALLQALFNRPGPYGHAFQSIIGWLYFGGTQVFLQDANSLMANTPDLVEIIKYLKEKFPSIQRITSYARARTLAKKSVSELKEIRASGLSRIHIGMETGYDPLLQYMKKGVTAKEQIQAGKNVVESGISLSEYVMPGLGGTRWWREHAVETARVLNQIDPDFIRLRTLYVRHDMPLYSKVEAGEFIRLSDDQVVSEIKLFIETLDGLHSTIVSDHILNLLEEVQGKLPEGKEKILAVIDRYLALPAEERLFYRVGRRLGYYRSLDDLQDIPLRQRIVQMIDEARRANNLEGTILSEEAEREIYRLMENYI
ncbi:MAG: radical SAM protein [Thermodesulfobacteriota bacterium]|nr:radical SAM protein [Thermodesulfobacteriota bacterium]